MAHRYLSSADRSRALVLGLVFLGIGAALFYIGGGEFICGEDWLPQLMRRSTWRGNGWMIGSECVAISFNEKWYGLRICSRFFNAPLLQVIMIGGAIGATCFFFTMLRNALFGVESVDNDDDA